MHAEVWEVQIYESLFSAEAAKHYFEVFFFRVFKIVKKTRENKFRYQEFNLASILSAI